jgi:hypothetical protein
MLPRRSALTAKSLDFAFAGWPDAGSVSMKGEDGGAPGWGLRKGGLEGPAAGCSCPESPIDLLDREAVANC